MDQQTIDTYNRMAVEYDIETTPFWEKFPRTFFDEFIKHAGKRTLDVGAGPGRDGVVLRDSGIDVVCIDASLRMVELAKERGLNATVADFLSLPFQDKEFDSVWAYTSLLHVSKKDFRKALDEIDRVLVPGGVLGLGLIEGDFEGYKESKGVTEARFFAFYTKDEVESTLRQRNYELVYFETFSPNTKNYLNFLFKKHD